MSSKHRFTLTLIAILAAGALAVPAALAAPIDGGERSPSNNASANYSDETQIIAGDAFRFQATPNSATIGQLRFGLDINKTVDKPPFATNGTGLVKNLNADRVDGKSAEDFVEKGSLLFAAVAANGAVGNHRGLPANTTSVSRDDGGDNQAFAVPFACDVSKCVATATLAAASDAPVSADAVPVLTVANHSSNSSMFVVTEVNAGDTAYPFSIQVIC